MFQSPARPFSAFDHGFTLIELLVVVAILSAASLLAFGIVTEDKAQIRYDETRLRLQNLRRAVLGQLGPASPDTVGGFVADNGDLPSDLATLLQRGSLLTQGVQSPLFDPQPDITSCANNGSDGITLTDSTALLVKGHRGDYLGGLSFNGHFRDGWGNVDGNAATDAQNFGWSVTLDSALRKLNVTSLGTDNTLGPVGASDFTADRSLEINSSDWLVPLQGWTVRVVNYTGKDIPSVDFPNQKLSVSLLVFRNTATGGQWLRYSTPVSNVCLDGTGDGLVGTTACAQSATFSFAANCKAGDAASGPSLIPQGRHLLVVTGDGDDTLWNSNDSSDWTHETIVPAAKKFSFTRVDAIAGIALPEARLELR